MASSSCMRLCHRCTRSVLHSKVTGGVALRYSTIQVMQRCSFTALRISSSTNNKANGFPALSGRSHTVVPHARHRWKQHLYYGDVSGKPLSTEAKGNEDTTGELSRRTNAAAAAVAAPYKKNRLSRRISDVVPAAAASQTALLDLDARRPRLSALEEISDEEARRPHLSALEEISDEEAISISVSSALPPPASLSLSEYVDKSETLSKLVQLGVNLWRLEQRPNVGSMLLRLDFQADVAPRLLFLKDLGLEDSGLGRLLSLNPFILTESLENLHARVNYLLSKKFSSQTVASMVARAPYLLNFSVKRLDNRLGFFQKHLGLSPDNTRDVVARLPRLLCGSLEPVKETLKVCKVEFGFKENEIQHIIIAVPKVLTANKKKLTQIFDYLHNTMNVPHHLIIKFPQVLNCRYLRIRERHLFLQYLSKDQYDPSAPNYVSLDRLVALPDDAFCTEVASATLEDFYLFQKTL